MQNNLQVKPFLWTKILRNIILPLSDVIVGRNMMKRLKCLEIAQWWDRDKLYDFRDNELRSLINIAYKEVPFYRQLLDTATVRPEDINTADDLKRIPILTKQMLKANYPDKTRRNTGQKTYEKFTSGSTGTNFRVLEDAETAGWYYASFLLALRWAGWNLGEPHLQTGMALQRSLLKNLKDIFFRCYYVSAANLTDPYLDKNLQLIEKYSIRHIWGYPGSLYFLAKRAREHGWNIPMKSIVTWGDNLYPNYRKNIEEVFKTKVFDTYGCAEGIQVSAQCGHSNTYHVHTLDTIIEYVDGNGLPVAPGEMGSIILTRLHPGPMPLIRYRVGDIGISGGQRVCDCGRGYEVMESIEGRDTDIILTPSGNRLIVHFFTGILEYFPEIESFQVLQEELQSITIRIVPAKTISRESIQYIEKILKERGAADLDIRIEIVNEIPLPPTGKRRFIKNNISY